jgi:hypothetical protein
VIVVDDVNQSSWLFLFTSIEYGRGRRRKEKKRLITYYGAVHNIYFVLVDIPVGLVESREGICVPLLDIFFLFAALTHPKANIPHYSTLPPPFPSSDSLTNHTQNNLSFI